MWMISLGLGSTLASGQGAPWGDVKISSPGSSTPTLLFENLAIDTTAYFSLELIQTTDIRCQRLGAVLLQ
tara:strand:- start:121 stop:330 length:210 start_codon:yes stop_codon:yes gene_type:complete